LVLLLLGREVEGVGVMDWIGLGCLGLRRFFHDV
jgi:hypothetical protein